MKDINIKGYSDTFFVPNVNFSADSGVCEISGESYLENTEEFYKPLKDWIREYIIQTGKDLTFNFKLTYFNTASSRSFLDLLNILKEYEDKGGRITINWYYQDWDEDMQQEAEDFAEDTGLKIKLIPFKS